MSKIVFVSDLHVHPYRLCSRDGGHDRLLDGLSVLRQSLDLARSHSAPWVFAGDMKVPKNSWPQEALTGALDIVREYGDVERVMVAGNHDAEGLGGSGLAPFFDTLGRKMRVVDKTGVIITDAADLVCVPWNGDLELCRQMLKRDSRRFLVAHGFLQGCMLGPEDSRIAKGTPVSDYGEFGVAVFGDVHKGQWRRPACPPRPAEWLAYPTETASVGGGVQVRKPAPWSGEVFYAGSPYQQNWGEREDPPKGALLVDVESGAVRIVSLKAPRFRHFEVGELGLVAFVDRYQAYVGDFVRIVYSGKAHPALDEARKLGDQFRSFQLIVKPEVKSERRADVHAGLDTREMLRRYVEARPPSDGVDRERALEALARLSGVPE